MHCRSSQSKVCGEFCEPTVADILLAEFRESITPAIPKLIALLSDRNLDVRMAGAHALLKLSEQGKFCYFMV